MLRTYAIYCFLSSAHATQQRCEILQRSCNPAMFCFSHNGQPLYADLIENIAGMPNMRGILIVAQMCKCGQWKQTSVLHTARRTRQIRYSSTGSWLAGCWITVCINLNLIDVRSLCTQHSTFIGQ